jgi:hypothetical protein
MARHFDAHRAAGDRVPESFYNDLDGWDESTRTIYAYRGREEDGSLSVSRMMSGGSLACLFCVLNEEQTVECYTTDQMLEHLDEHRTWGLFVADHVYEKLERDRSDNDQVIQRYLDEHGFQRPAAPRWRPHSIFPRFLQTSTHYGALGQLAAMLVSGQGQTATCPAITVNAG